MSTSIRNTYNGDRNTRRLFASMLFNYLRAQLNKKTFEKNSFFKEKFKKYDCRETTRNNYVKCNAKIFTTRFFSACNNRNVIQLRVKQLNLIRVIKNAHFHVRVLSMQSSC